MLDVLRVNELSVGMPRVDEPLAHESKATLSPQLFLGDCLDIIPRLKDSSINLLLTDPPYGFNYLSRSHKLPLTRIKNDRHEAMPLLRTMLRAIYPKLTDDATGMIFTNWQCEPSIRAIIEEEGYVITNVLVWDKGSWSRGDLRGNWGYQYEQIIFFRKKTLVTRLRRWLNGKREGNILEYKKLPTNKYTHPTEKPVSLLKYLIEKVTKPGEVILDPFAGSGSTLLATQETGRIGIGIELEPIWYEVASQRLEMPAA